MSDQAESPDSSGRPAAFRVVTGKPPADPGRTLLALRYDAGPAEADAEVLTLGIPNLGDASGQEHYRSDSPVESGIIEGIRYRANDEVLFASVEVPEKADLAETAHETYRRIQKFQDRVEHRHMLRVWNYFPAINDGEGDAERYRQFCVGRARALHEVGALEMPFPAATCVGSHSGPLVVYWLAARDPGAQIENPRQVSAYHYPPRYGPVSPSFSRATLKNWHDATHFYISGTASVVGHESRYPGDVRGQTDETLRNLEALLDQAAAASPRMQGATLRDLGQLKAYVRRPGDRDIVQSMIEQRIGRQVPCLYLQADICRAELLVEVEAVCVRPAEPG